jgi:hypothetical protein
MPWRDELKTIDLGDERLNKRAGVVLESLGRAPECSINAACDGWDETHAAYRFFDNDKVTPQKILQPHVAATHARIAREDVVLLVQDTTELDYSAHPPAGAGPLTSQERLGFLDHSHVAFTPQGLCLGVLASDVIVRDPETLGQSKQRQYDPLETKETFRWLQGFRRACELQQQVPQTQIISVADREGDLYEVYVEAQQHETPADFVIRSGKVRSLPERDEDAPGVTYRKLKQAVEAAEVVVLKDAHLPRTPQREARDVQLEMRARQVTLKPPHTKSDQPPVSVDVVLVREVDPPDDGTGVEWLLVTSLPIDTPGEVLQVVEYYIARWPIEIYFRVLKTGCRVEEVQLETSERLLRCLMLYRIVAWRLMYLTYLGRECPDLSCDVMFAEHEWKSVWCVTQDEPLPDAPPPLDEFLLIVARLGGHNNRRHDGPPGPQSLWTGLRRLHDFATAWLAFGTSKRQLVCN